jgi:hypothetical protein
MKADRHMREPNPTLVNVLIRDCRSITIGMLITIHRQSRRMQYLDIKEYTPIMSARESKIGQAQNVRSNVTLETGDPSGKHSSFAIDCS